MFESNKICDTHIDIFTIENLINIRRRLRTGVAYNNCISFLAYISVEKKKTNIIIIFSDFNAL